MSTCAKSTARIVWAWAMALLPPASVPYVLLGETADVGATLAVISDAPPDGGGGGDAKAEPKAEEKSEPEPEPEPEDEPEEAATKAEAAGKTEDEASDEASEDQSAEPEPEPEAPQERAPSRAGTRPADGRPSGRPVAGGGKVLSPVVRRLLAEHDLDPESIEGSGAGGRITRDDVLKVIDGGAAKARGPRPSQGRT